MPIGRTCAGSCIPTSNGALGVDWTSLVVKDLVKLVLRLVTLLNTRCTIHSVDCVVGLALACRIPLVAWPSTVVVALSIVVVVATREAAAFLFFFVRLVLHHVS